MTEKIRIPKPSILALLAPETVDAEQRTVEVTFYSGATVPRFSWSRGEYLLTFEMKPSAVRLNSLNSGRAPVLETHSEWSTKDVLGVVEKGWLADGEARARLRFAKSDEDADRVWNKVEQKILRNVSMGVLIHKMQETSAEGKTKSFLATDWEPYEISVVPVGADPGAHIRMQAESAEEVEVEVLRATAHQEEKLMEHETITQTGAEARVEVNMDAERQAAALAERTRILELDKIGRAVRLDSRLIAEHVEKGTGIEEFRRVALDELARRSEETPIRSATAAVTRDGAETRRAGIAASLLHRYDAKLFPLKDELGRDWTG